MRLEEEEAPAAGTPPAGTPLAVTPVKATPAKAAEARQPARLADDDACGGSGNSAAPASLPREARSALELLAAQLGAAARSWGRAPQPGCGSWEEVSLRR